MERNFKTTISGRQQFQPPLYPGGIDRLLVESPGITKEMIATGIDSVYPVETVGLGGLRSR